LPTADGEWRERFIADPTEVFLRAIALRLQKTADASAGVTCQPGDDATSFRVQLGGKEHVLSFGLEQSRWKLLRGGLSERTRSSFLDELDRPRGHRKKWKPSLK
jgi:hypothetical protein